MDWPKFVETMSTVEKFLMEDPGGVYRQMDFTTRDLYRHKIENIAKKSALSEEETARIAIRLSKEAADLKSKDDRTAHVGYYLIDKGLKKFESLVKVRFSADCISKKIKPPDSFVVIQRFDYSADCDLHRRFIGESL
jgi:cyclic beta-1,2-glucan synthetase